MVEVQGKNNNELIIVKVQMNNNDKYIRSNGWKMLNNNDVDRRKQRNNEW